LAEGCLPVSLYLRAFVSMISCSKSLRSDLKTFFEGSPVLSVSSWRVSSLPSVLRAFMTCSSVLLSFIVLPSLMVSLCYGTVGFFNFAV